MYYVYGPNGVWDYMYMTVYCSTAYAVSCIYIMYDLHVFYKKGFAPHMSHRSSRYSADFELFFFYFYETTYKVFSRSILVLYSVM